MAELVANELIAARVRRGLASRLLAPQLIALLAHVVALAGLAALLRGTVPERSLIVWAAAVLLVTGGRAVVTAWATRRQPPLESLRRVLSVVMTAALEDALGNVKTLTGLLPIGASCKTIRDDQGYWNQIEVYVRDHSEADFSHGLCPDCVRRLYPDFASDPT